jgi:tetratricopeptide (TPR) repeat protein
VRRAAAAAAVALLALARGARAADPPGSPRANQALTVCLADAATPAERRANLARGLALAEEAVAADERDPKAHFAVFCNLGNDLKLRGVALQSLFAMRRLRREIDRTLELAPDYADALVGKGELLLELPRLLGGDAAEGERLLRAALRVDPDYIDAHLGLARALAARGARDEARAEAQRALAAAERVPDPARATAARELLAQLAE